MDGTDNGPVTRAKVLESVAERLNDLQLLLMGEAFPCEHPKDGVPCTRQYEGKFDREGRPRYYFAPGCKVVIGFCDPCSAYWHIAVARNAALRMGR